MLDIRRALEYPSADPKAGEKIGLGAVVLLAPVLNLAALGYQVEVARRVAANDPRPLPEWNELGRLWVQGARLGLAYFIYSLPSLIIVLGAMAAVFVGLIVSVQSEPVQSGAAPAAPPPGVVVIFLLLVAAAVVYNLLFSLLRSAVLVEYARWGSVQACFDFAAMLRFIRQNLGEYLKLWLAELVLSWLAGLVMIFLVFALGLIPFIGPLLLALVAGGAAFFQQIVSGHLVGQLTTSRPQSPL